MRQRLSDRGYLLVLIILFCGAGCVTSRVQLYNEDLSYPATDPASIKIFEKKPQGRSFIELGEITVDEATSWKQVERIFKIKAAEFGADAIYVYKKTEQSGAASPHPCHFTYGHGYPHGYSISHGHDYGGHVRHYHHRFHHSYRYDYYPKRYYYCYGSAYTETTWLMAVGIAIKYNDVTTERGE